MGKIVDASDEKIVNAIAEKKKTTGPEATDILAKLAAISRVVSEDVHDVAKFFPGLWLRMLPIAVRLAVMLPSLGSNPANVRPSCQGHCHNVGGEKPDHGEGEWREGGSFFENGAASKAA